MKMKPTGIRVRHTGGATNQLYAVEVPQRPYSDGGYTCPLCKTAPVVVHTAKTVHLYLEPDGGCLVSPDVYELLKEAGMPNLQQIGVTYQPPPTVIGPKAASLNEQRNHQRRITILPHIPVLTGDTHGTVDC